MANLNEVKGKIDLTFICICLYTYICKKASTIYYRYQLSNLSKFIYTLNKIKQDKH